MLHVLNGDSTRMGIERSGIPGTFLVWPDVLYEGPTPLAAGEKWIRTRVRYLNSLVQPADGDLIERYRQNDAALEAFREHEEVVFWLEHDLYDQLLLIRHLWWLGERVGRAGPERSGLQPSGSRAAGTSSASGNPSTSGNPTTPDNSSTPDKSSTPDNSRRPDLSGPASPRLSLVCRDVYLGPLQPEEFSSLFEARQPITDTQIATGSEIWRAFCAADPRALTRFATEYTDYPELPFLKAALRRHLEEFPSAGNGLSRTESQMLRVLQDGPLTLGAAFRASTELEERMFMGDLSFWGIAKTLATVNRPLITMDPAPNGRMMPRATLRITDAGRDVLAGAVDQIAVNGIDRWLGGVHLTRLHGYRWNPPEVIPW